MHGANLVRAVHDLDAKVAFWGLGGQRMRKAGVEIPFDATKLAVVGISEVFRHLWQIVGAQRLLRKAMRNERPDLVILIDYPDFNLLLAAKAKALGIPVMYYISPQVWAWRSGRVKKIRRFVEKMVVVLPFELEFYRKNQVDVDFVGHPLLDIVRPAVNDSVFCERYEIDRNRPIVGLFPGSRLQEVERLVPPMADAAGRLEKEIPGIQFVLPLAPTIDKKPINDFMRQTGLRVKVVEDGAYDTMKAARAVIVASGTVTLEAAIMGVPMVIIYKVSRLSYLAGRCMVKVPYIGLVNLVAGRKIVPELVQEEASGDRIAEEVYRIMVNEKYSATMRYELEEVKNKLGSAGASVRAAHIAYQLLNKR